ncbi:MAG: nucleotidyltransferase domain-containing protein [Paludibacteraceae bacterium]|nr:nucleotidyltransferase domain-containing protein [Paludibacteraceae bacterium]
MSYGLTDIQLTQLQELFSKHPRVEKVILYGSRAKGNYRKGSDVDITLVGAQLGKTDLNTIETEIDDLLFPFFFDISLLHQISNNDLLEHINRVGITLFEK